MFTIQKIGRYFIGVGMYVLTYISIISLFYFA